MAKSAGCFFGLLARRPLGFGRICWWGGRVLLILWFRRWEVRCSGAGGWFPSQASWLGAVATLGSWCSSIPTTSGCRKVRFRFALMVVWFCMMIIDAWLVRYGESMATLLLLHREVSMDVTIIVFPPIVVINFETRSTFYLLFTFRMMKGSRCIFPIPDETYATGCICLSFSTSRMYFSIFFYIQNVFFYLFLHPGCWIGQCVKY
jgi:hypothetical protein